MENRIIVRKVLKGLGIFGVLLFLLGIRGGYYLFAGSAAVLFLGVTDFGRQCPLILSVRHLAYRIRSKRKPVILSANPIKEISEGESKNRLS